MRCAHTLKGVAGNLGARRLQEYAKHLESACQAGSSDDEIKRRLDHTVGELKVVMGGLTALGGDPGNVVNSAEVDPDIRPRLALLHELLEDNDGNAGEVMEELEHHPALSGRRPLVAKLASAIEDYDCDQALVHLAELNKELR